MKFVFKIDKKWLIGLGMMGLVGCQSLPAPETKTAPKPAPAEKKEIKTPDGVIITPYEREEIQRKKMQVVVPDQKTKQQFEDGRQLPAFQKLMQQTQLAYKQGQWNKAEASALQGQWNKAEASALQAQRLAPQSAETFLYLGLIANQKNKPANAEALAQRGLSYAQSNAMKRQLWSVILKAGQLQKNTKTVQQAQKALQGL
ncbi:tetratricopeptide repeat protein [Acinetobacter bouvetii]|uniref:Tetratricopeptide repeat protein n=1 Tax=Acinetobacter bouvetii TaxID=202951 RepID=A0A811GBW8_9GAMM|nr:tetratricopeptide repeat protein [Acinetobacter bouvetii]CAB1214045.1 hypothetical protein SFB21_1408 [Acinetobacter bouvetii]